MDCGHGKEISFANSFLGLISRNCILPVLLLCAGCRGLAVNIESLPARQAEPALPLEVAWTYNARAGFGPDAPLIFANTVMVGTRQGEVHVIDLATGKRKGNKRFGDAINGTPAVIGQTMAVPLAQGRRAVAAYNLDQASMRWRTRGAPVQVGITPAGSGGILVNTDGEVQHFDLETGSVIWTYQIQERTQVYTRPLIHRDMVLVATDSGTILALSLPDGDLEWSADIDSPVHATPALQEETLFISTTRGRLVAMDLQTRGIHWDMVLEDETVRLSAPAVGDELVAVGGSDGMLRILYLDTGELAWEAQCPDALVAKPLLTQDVIYTGSMGNGFYAFDRHSGELLQTIELRGRVKSAIGMADDGLVVLTEPRYVIKLVSSNLDAETQ